MLRNLFLRRLGGLAARLYQAPSSSSSVSNFQPTTSTPNPESYENAETTVFDDLNEKPSFDVTQLLPRQFISEKLKNTPPNLRNKIAGRISEMQLFVDTFGSSALSPLSEEECSTFLRLPSIQERTDYLDTLRRHKEALDKRAHAERPLISLVNKEREEKGEIVYASDFNTLLDIKGAEFRKLIDHMFFVRSSLNLSLPQEAPPQLLVDCQFLREFAVRTQSRFVGEINDLHNSNWTSRRPFDVSLVNFLPDLSLADLAKRRFLFHYGPSRDPQPELSSEAENPKEEPDTFLTEPEEKPFEPHPFAPKIKSRKLHEALEGVNKDEVIYISWTAKQALPEVPPSNIKYVILCASHDLNPSTSSQSAAIRHGLEPYRIPTEKYVVIYKRHRALPLRQSVAILADYFAGVPLGKAIQTHYDVKVKRSEKDREEMLEAVKSTLISRAEERVRETIQRLEREKWLNSSTIPKDSPNNPATTKSRTRDAKGLPPDGSIDDGPRVWEKRKRVHRYSREERNARRAEEKAKAAQSSI